MSALCALLVFDIVEVPDRIAEDFKSFYLAGAAVLEGKNFYDVEVLRSLAAQRGLRDPVFPYLYPPPLAHCAAWLASLPGRSAQLVAWGVSVASLGAACAASALLLGPRGRRELVGAGEGAAANLQFALAAMLLWLLNVRASIHWGQVNPLVVSLLLLAVVCYVRRADTACGVLLGLAASVKVTPALLLVHCWATRRYRAFVGFALAIAATVPIDPLGWWTFIARLPDVSHGSSIPGLFHPSSVANFSLAGFVARLTDEPLVMRLVPMAVAGALLLPIVLRGRRSRDDVTQRLLLGPLLVVMVIASPLAYAHHVLLLLPGALVQVVFLARHRPVWQLGLLMVLFAVASVDFPAFYHRFGFGDLGWRLASFNLYALLAIYAFGMAIARPEPREEPVAARI